MGEKNYRQKKRKKDRKIVVGMYRQMKKLKTFQNLKLKVINVQAGILWLTATAFKNILFF